MRVAPVVVICARAPGASSAWRSRRSPPRMPPEVLFRWTSAWPVEPRNARTTLQGGSWRRSPRTVSPSDVFSNARWRRPFRAVSSGYEQACREPGMPHGSNLDGGQEAGCPGQRGRSFDGCQDGRLQVPKNAAGLALAQRQQFLESRDQACHGLMQIRRSGGSRADCQSAAGCSESRRQVTIASGAGEIIQKRIAGEAARQIQKTAPQYGAGGAAFASRFGSCDGAVQIDPGSRAGGFAGVEDGGRLKAPGCFQGSGLLKPRPQECRQLPGIEGRFGGQGLDAQRMSGGADGQRAVGQL